MRLYILLKTSASVGEALILFDYSPDFMRELWPHTASPRASRKATEKQHKNFAGTQARREREI